MNQATVGQQVLLLLLLARAVSNCAVAEEVAVRIRRVENGLVPAIVVEGGVRKPFSVDERMRFYKTPGLSIAVINNGVVEWARGYGVREAGTTNPVVPETIFQAASISKPVAAMVALRLVDEGKLDLDEDVNRKLITWKLPENEFMKEKKVTLRLLLSHRAGLTDNAGFLRAMPNLSLPTLRDILESGKWTPAPIRVGLEPDSRFRYSGGGYCLIEQLVEDVSGKPFPELARELVFEPLNMTNSSFEQPLSEDRARKAATGHRTDGSPLPQKWNIYPATSAAGLWTTPSDLARFVIEIQKSKAGQSHTVLSARMASEMLAVQGHQDARDSKAIATMEAFSGKLPLGRGLGVGLIGREPFRFFQTGANPGYQCEFHAYIHGGKGAVVMTNADQGWRLGREILWSIAKEYDWPAYDYEPEVKRVAQIDSTVLGRLVGEYRLSFAAPTNRFINISCEEGRLFAQMSGHSYKIAVYPESDAKYFSIEDAMSLTFVEDEAGTVSEVVSDQGWRAKRSKRMKSDN